MNQHVPASTIEQLAGIIAERARSGDESSYTRRLLEKGLPKVCKKLGEEATEVVVAALAQDRNALVGEIADLVYHLLVLMEAANIDMAEVGAVLDARMGQSGLAEKASRKQP